MQSDMEFQLVFIFKRMRSNQSFQDCNICFLFKLTYQYHAVVYDVDH